MTLTKVLAAVAAGVALVGCQQGHQARADTVDATLDRPFTLAGGQQAAISGTPLRLRFAGVPEDSRCPAQVECFWTGRALVTVVVDSGTGEPTTVEFDTDPAPAQNRQTVPAAGHAVTLQALDPYPETPDPAIAFADYRATLVVRGAA
jgi:hypothetical protein